MGIPNNISFTESPTSNYYDPITTEKQPLTGDVTDPTYDIVSQMVIPTIYFLIATIGLTGNGIVLYIMGSMIKSKSVTDVYVTNLAIADIFLLSNLPFWATELILGEWVFGKSMCKIASCMTYMNMYASIFFLAAMSLDRWLAIVKAIKCRSLRTVRNAWITCLIIWGVGVMFIILPALFRTTKIVRGKERCIWLFPAESQVSLNLTYNVSRTIVGFMVPLMVIIFCYTDLNLFMRKRSKAKKNKNDNKKKDKLTIMIMVVISCFVISWLPNQITNFVHLLKLLGVLDYNCVTTDKKIGLHADLALLNSTLSSNLTGWNLNEFLGGNTSVLFSSIASFAENNFPSGFNKTLDLLRKPKSCSNFWTVMHIHLITACLGFSNSMMNPLVYSFMSLTFRKKLRILFSCAPKGDAFLRRHRQSFWTSMRYTTTTRIRSSVVGFSRRHRKSNTVNALNKNQGLGNNLGLAGTTKDSLLINQNPEEKGEQQQHLQVPQEQLHHSQQENKQEEEQEERGLFPDYYEADLDHIQLCDVTLPHVTRRSVRKRGMFGSLRNEAPKSPKVITGVSEVLEEPTERLEEGEDLGESHLFTSTDDLYGGVWMGSAI